MARGDVLKGRFKIERDPCKYFHHHFDVEGDVFIKNTKGELMGMSLASDGTYIFSANIWNENPSTPNMGDPPNQIALLNLPAASGPVSNHLEYLGEGLFGMEASVGLHLTVAFVDDLGSVDVVVYYK